MERVRGYPCACAIMLILFPLFATNENLFYPCLLKVRRNSLWTHLPWTHYECSWSSTSIFTRDNGACQVDYIHSFWRMETHLGGEDTSYKHGRVPFRSCFLAILSFPYKYTNTYIQKYSHTDIPHIYTTLTPTPKPPPHLLTHLPSHELVSCHGHSNFH